MHINECAKSLPHQDDKRLCGIPKPDELCHRTFLDIPTRHSQNEDLAIHLITDLIFPWTVSIHWVPSGYRKQYFNPSMPLARMEECYENWECFTWGGGVLMHVERRVAFGWPGEYEFHKNPVLFTCIHSA